MKVSDLPEIYEELKELGFTHMIVCFPVHIDCEFEESPVLHVAGYPAKPTKEDREALIQELATDKTFNLTEWTYDRDYWIEVLTR